MSGRNRRPSESGAATPRAASFAITRQAFPKEWSCSMRSITFRRRRRTTSPARWNCKAGKCGSCSAEINGMPKLMCMTRLSDLPLEKPVTVQPMKAFPVYEGLDHRCVVEFSGEEKDQEVQTATTGCARWNVAHAAGRTSIACRNSGNASSAFFARMFVTFCAIITCTISLSDRVS